MKKTRSHIILKIISLLLAVSFIFPYVHKFDHFFVHHKDDVCLGIVKTAHLHEININCDFYKFKIYIPQTIPPVFNVELFSPIENQQEIASQYSFLQNHEQLHFSLRGPPSLV